MAEGFLFKRLQQSPGVEIHKPLTGVLHVDLGTRRKGELSGRLCGRDSEGKGGSGLVCGDQGENRRRGLTGLPKAGSAKAVTSLGAIPGFVLHAGVWREGELSRLDTRTCWVGTEM